MRLRLDEINPFDHTHVAIDMAPGFSAFDKEPGEHLNGARYCAGLIRKGVSIQPIAICKADLVPADRRNRHSDRPWQRLDGFKRYWGHVLAGQDTITCVVMTEYRPGAQHGEKMESDT